MDPKTVHMGVHTHRKKKRIGRGVGSKRGKTATRGGKGQTARSGDLPRLLKEGGQMQLFRRLPKRGFNNNAFRLTTAVVNLNAIADTFDGTEPVTLEALEQSGLAKVKHDRVKVLAEGDIAKALTVHAHAFSAAAKEKIEKAGGQCVVVPGKHVGPKVRNKMRPRPPKRVVQ
jgi:large subunit ribosomal protein L15